MTDFTHRIHHEKSIDNFTAQDGTVRFYNFVKAIMLRNDVKTVLDFGAGRGSFWWDTQSVYRRHIRDLRTCGARVTAADVDNAVLSHPCSHEQVVLDADGPLPFENEAFDLIVSDMTFEHLEHPDAIAKELLRILKPNGYICARTPNRFGYVRLVSSLLPNRLHVGVLKSVQPNRDAEDVFPTYYRLNSPQQAERAFCGRPVYHYYDSAEPSYYFGNRWLYRAFLTLHRVLPAPLSTSLCLFIRQQ